MSRTKLDLSTAKPREVEAYLREQVRRYLGDEVENRARVYAARGYYSVYITLDSDRYVEFQNFRKTDAGKIAKAIRALGAK